MKWYRLAAANGSDSAMYNVGVLYENGIGVGKNRDQALVWYRGAARAGNVEAKRTLKSLGVTE
jgi:TPR repeat protein